MAIVLKEIDQLESLERKLEGIEERTGKKQIKRNIFLRLSDAMAGFLREVYEKEEYVLTFIKRFKAEKIVMEA